MENGFMVKREIRVLRYENGDWKNPLLLVVVEAAEVEEEGGGEERRWRSEVRWSRISR